MALLDVLSPDYLLSTFGLFGIIFIVFAETGLLFGFFFPGDSLLFLAGAYAATSEPGLPHLPILPLVIGVVVAAILGGQTGYWIGARFGDQILSHPKSRFIKPEYITKTREILEKYGEMKAVMIARVIPIARTFISPTVGAIGMPRHKFMIANIVGGVIWGAGITLLGYWLGSAINIDAYILPITAVVILASVIPVALEYTKHRRRKRTAGAPRDNGSAE